MTEAAGHPRPPIHNSYWVRQGRFGAGEYPGDHNPEVAAEKIRGLLEEGITHFINLTEDRDLLAPYAGILEQEAEQFGTRVIHDPHPIRNMSIPRDPKDMARTLDAIDQALEAGESVYLHCWGGVGRTGTVVGCWLVRQGMTGDEALEQIREWWVDVPRSLTSPVSPETGEQRDYVRNWRED